MTIFQILYIANTDCNPIHLEIHIHLIGAQKERAVWLPYMIHIHLRNCINPKYYSIHVDIQLNTAPFYPINHLERQKERDDNFLHKSKNSLRWILKGNRPKNFQNSTFFTNTIELA